MPRGNPNHDPWTDEEVAVLKEMYRHWPIDYSPLSHRPRQNVYQKANRLGLTKRREVGPVFSEVTSEQWAYFAGIIDGEGTIHMSGSVYKKKRFHNKVICVVNTDRPLIDWMLETFPGGSCYLMRHPDRQDETFKHYKPIWKVTWTRHDLMVELLRGMLPHLIVKRDKADAMLAALV